MIIKGGNSGRNEIANNKGDFRDSVCLNPVVYNTDSENAKMKIFGLAV